MPQDKQPLSPRQAEVFAMIKDFITQHGYAPSMREIGRAMGISSPNAVVNHIAMLRRKGWLEDRPANARARTLAIAADAEPPRPLPIIKALAAVRDTLKSTEKPFSARLVIDGAIYTISSERGIE